MANGSIRKKAILAISNYQLATPKFITRNLSYLLNYKVFNLNKLIRIFGYRNFRMMLIKDYKYPILA